VIGITANAAGFNKGLKSVQGQLSGFQSAIGALAGVTVGSALGMMVKDTLDGIETQADFADSLGMTVQQLNEFGLAAKQANMSQEEFHGSLGKLSKTLGEIQMGDAEKIGTFAAMGIDATTLASMNQGEALKMLADRYQQLQDPVAKSMLLITAFGKSGAKMAPMMAGGSAGLDAAAKRANALKGPITDEDIARVREMNDATDELAFAWEGVKEKMTIAALPGIKAAVDWIGNAFSLWPDALVTIDAAWNTWLENIHHGRRAIIDFMKLFAPEGSDFEAWLERGRQAAIRDATIRRDMAEAALQKGFDNFQARHNPQKGDAGKEADRSMEIAKKRIDDAKKLGTIFDDMAISIRKTDQPFLVMINKLEAVGATIEQINAMGMAMALDNQIKQVSSEQFQGLPTALKAGTSDAISFQNRFEAKQKFDDEKLKELEELREARKANLAKLDEIKEEIKKIGIPPPADIAKN